MKQQISTPVAVVIAVVVVAIIAVVGWKMVNRESAATNVGSDGVKISAEGSPAPIPGQATPASNASLEKAGGAAMTNATQ